MIIHGKKIIQKEMLKIVKELYWNDIQSAEIELLTDFINDFFDHYEFEVIDFHEKYNHQI